MEAIVQSRWSLVAPVIISFLVIVLFTGFPMLDRIRKALKGYVGRRNLCEKAQLMSSQSSDSSGIEISGIFIHPVKSLRPVSVTSATIDSIGLVGDRRLMLVQPICTVPHTDVTQFGRKNPSHRFVTQRQCASLATITSSLPTVSPPQSGHVFIHLSSSRVPNSTVSIDISDHTVQNVYKNRYVAGIWDDVVEVVDVGDEAATFIRSVIQTEEEFVYDYYKDIRVVSMIPRVTKRRTNEKYVPVPALSYTGSVPHVALTDGFPILIASEESLDELNQRLVTKGKKTLPMSRFRPNIVVRGLSKPFEEDTWKAIQVGGPTGPILHIVKGCPRCKQSCTDQLTGERDTEPLETLAEFRALGKNKEDVYFAQNVVLQYGSNGGKINVGDQVTVLTKGTPVWDSDPVVSE